ncbi:MAG: nucleoside triphosphate pyrophosphohydrolase [Aurantimonas endophytica]|uniref:nucleoside triphosphate pyrophosphohydrolase n=1 Tax=Aurantimonas endophytica TaxID=1522175 RepID=UPI0030015231
MTPSREITRLIEIMAALRDPASGCPWDLEQDFSTIAPYTVEEAYEVADAIERDDMVDLREELGDLLLQVVYHAQLAAEAGSFDFGDVVDGVTRKMIRRHPHVFGDAEARSAGSAQVHWERIKAEERAEKAALRQANGSPTNDAGTDTGARHLDGVSTAFPALTLALKVQKQAAEIGFDWDSAGPIIAKIDEELAELAEAVAARDADASEAELGDLLFSVVNLARFHRIDPEVALRRCVLKFRDRFGFIETELAASGRSLQAASLEEMEALWIAAKTRPSGTAG